jgi:UDP-glucuronate 4-epimerase
MTILVTGAAGFIGFHLCRRLIHEGHSVIGVDNLNSYYDPALKKARLEQLNNTSTHQSGSFKLLVSDLEDAPKISSIFKEYSPDKVVNLAAQAGVRYSITNPSAYIQSNIVGFLNILEGCRNHDVKNLLYASSSSVYGGNTKLPFSELDSVDHPVSLYAATKKSNELMAHTYSHLYGLPSIGLRFFTVYGPWGRPDMALFLFTKAISEGVPIQVFNNGNMIRDFTYIDDIIESLIRLLSIPAKPDPDFNSLQPNSATSWAPHKVFNIGNSSPTPLMSYIEAIEKSLGIKAIINYLPMQPGDVQATSADTSLLSDYISFRPKTPVETGISRFVEWYKSFYAN